MPSSVILRQRALTLTWNGTVNFADREEWQNHTDVMNPANTQLISMFNSSRNTGGLEVYFVKTLSNGGELIGGVNCSLGMALANGTEALSGAIFAHEVLHQCGLQDIYVETSTNNTTMVLSGPVSHSRMHHDDWGGGFYGQEASQADIARKLAMYGVAGETAFEGGDIPSGAVYGLKYTYDHVGGTSVWSLGNANVGQDGMAADPPRHL